MLFLVFFYSFAINFCVRIYSGIVRYLVYCNNGNVLRKWKHYIAKFLYRQVVNDRSNFNLTFQTKLIYFLFLFNIISIYGLLELISYIGDVYSQPYYSDMWSFVPNLISIDRYSGNLYYPIILKYSLYLFTQQIY